MLTHYSYDGWALYVVDVEEKQLMVMDPVETSELPEEMMVKHEGAARRIVANLCKAIQVCIPGWEVSASGWNFSYNWLMHPSCDR
jgi:hypothetical protein